MTGGEQQKNNRSFNGKHESNGAPNEPNNDSHDPDYELIGSLHMKDLIFNYSSFKLSEPMKSLLGRALNFAVMPLKLDITEVLVDFNRFARAAIWHEYWHGREKDKDYKKPLFRSQKNNLPKNYQTPKGLKSYLDSVKSAIMDPRNRNKEDCNLPVEEVQALKELIKMQRDRVIIIKPCDKGAGILILDFKSYMKSCYEHLLEKQSSTQNYYKKVSELDLERAKAKIYNTLEEALNNKVITDEEFNAMNPEDKNPGKFYCNFKIHKPHTPLTTPPPRPIVSGSGSITENIGIYVENQIKELATQHKTYLQDTPHFFKNNPQTEQGSKAP